MEAPPDLNYHVVFKKLNVTSSYSCDFLRPKKNPA